MLSLERKSLLKNGEYFVIGVDLEQYAAAEPEKYLRGILNNDTDDAAVKAYQSYLAIIPSAPVEFGEFAKQVSVLFSFYILPHGSLVSVKRRWLNKQIIRAGE